MLNFTTFYEIITSFYKELQQTNKELSNTRLSDDKWSLKEIVGHLIDSASNNHQRFVRLQFGDLLDFPVYEGEAWIGVQKYINMDWDVLVTLWYSFNCLLLNIVKNADSSAYENVWIKGETAIPLETLIKDYYKHIELHIEHFNSRVKELG